MIEAHDDPNLCPLSDLPLGEQGIVFRLDVDGGQRRRLLDFGLTPGASVTAELASPPGDPVAYRIRGALIALRAEQTRRIIVRREPSAAQPRGDA